MTKSNNLLDGLRCEKNRISVLKMTQFQIVFSGNMVSTEDLGM